jgi:hypothetical protein
MAGSQILTSVSILNTLLGFQAISLTDITLTSVSQIAAGSVVEIGSAFFQFASAETINATSWSGITTATTAYLALTPSGTAGSQIVSAAWTATTPVWSTSKQGWYASAASVTRIVGSAYKVGATSYSNKNIFSEKPFSNWHGITETITSGSGNYIVPKDVTRIKVTCIGGGGAGGSSVSGGSFSGGGGGGTDIALAMKILSTIIYVIPGQSIAYSVGSTGVQTTFVGAITGTPGSPGTNGSSTYAGIGGVGSTGGAGVPGANGTVHSVGIAQGYGGNGGGVGGIGGGNPSGTYNGSAGSYGGGGGGAGGYNSAATGGAGGSGIIIIEY